MIVDPDFDGAENRLLSPLPVRVVAKPTGLGRLIFVDGLLCVVAGALLAGFSGPLAAQLTVRAEPGLAWALATLGGIVSVHGLGLTLGAWGGRIRVKLARITTTIDAAWAFGLLLLLPFLRNYLTLDGFMIALGACGLVSGLAIASALCLAEIEAVMSDSRGQFP
jgi:hypothetical protein